MIEFPVPPLLPSEPRPRPAHGPADPPAAQRLQRSELLLATAKIDHSGRVGDRMLLAALGWQPGDQHDVRAIQQGVELYRSRSGRFRVDSRGHVFLPAATRAVLGVRSGDRVVLVASPAADALVVHPVAVVAVLLEGMYRNLAGDYSGG